MKTRRGKNEWLLIKERDAYASEQGTDDYPHDSVLSGRTVEQVAAGQDRVDRHALRGCEKLGAKRRAVRASRVEAHAGDAGQAVHRRRVGCSSSSTTATGCSPRSSDGRTTLYSRAGNDFTATFPDVADVVAALPYDDFIVDGEVIVLDERGLPSFASAAEARASDAPHRRRARGARAAGDALRVRSARPLAGFDFVPLRARRPQGHAAGAVADRGAAALLRARREAGRGDVRRGRAHGARGYRWQTGALAVRHASGRRIG